MWVKKAMNPRQRVSAAAIALIKRFEGLRNVAAQLEDGRWTVGYGHTRSTRAGATVSEADAEALLTYDLVEVQQAIDDLVFTPLTQNQFDALVSFVFNIGLDGFRHSSVLRRLNEGALLQAACAMEMWRKADFEGERIVIDALVRRRAAEKALFLTPEDGFVAAPSAVVQPKVDFDVGAAVPRVRPTEFRRDPASAAPSPVRREFNLSADDEAASSSAWAAEAVSARLQDLLPDENGAGETDPFPADPPPDTAAAVEPDAAAPARASVRSIFDETRDDSEQGSAWPLVILGVIGLALFVGGLAWAFVSRPAAGLGGSPIVGFALGFLGIVCVGNAVYFLLERLWRGRD
jgi:lysozyme